MEIAKRFDEASKTYDTPDKIERAKKNSKNPT